MLHSLPARANGLLRAPQKRVLPARGPRPASGAYLVYGHVRMIVQDGLNDELWDWLQARGWRQCTYRPDRRRYREAPPGCMLDLIDIPRHLRPLVLHDALAGAIFPPT
jgi:hypothetical protein